MDATLTTIAVYGLVTGILLIGAAIGLGFWMVRAARRGQLSQPLTVGHWRLIVLLAFGAAVGSLAQDALDSQLSVLIALAIAAAWIWVASKTTSQHPVKLLGLAGLLTGVFEFTINWIIDGRLARLLLTLPIGVLRYALWGAILGLFALWLRPRPTAKPAK